MATMVRHERRLAHAARKGPERARLRGEVLRLGELLGWQAQDIILFTEALVQQSWRQCGTAEFAAVLEEQRSLLAAVAAKAIRRLAREQDRAQEAWTANAGAATQGVPYADRH